MVCQMSVEKNTKKLSWIDYKKIVNKKFTDIILDKFTLKKLLFKERKSIRLPNYQVQFLEENYPQGNFSEALRDLIDDFIDTKAEKNILLEQNILLEDS